MTTVSSPLGQSGFVPLDRLPMSSIRRDSELDLDGTWDFQLLPTYAEPLGDEWESTEVPSLWTMRDERDRAHYTNVQMPFDEVPPNLPERNATGVYRRNVELAPQPGRRIILSVGAAESALAAFVNEVRVGSSTDSHLAAEFDITDAVVDGTNEILLVVARWNAESYLEDQDHWWHAGISRPVTIHTVPEMRLADARIVADFDPATGLGSLDLEVTTHGLAHLSNVDWGIEVSFAGQTHRLPIGARVVTQSLPKASAETPRTRPEDRFPPDFMDLLSIRAAGAEVPPRFAAIAAGFAQTVTSTAVPAGVARGRWEGLRVRPWSAERPQLSEVVVRLLDPEGVVVDEASWRVGFRRVEIVGRDLLVNGKRVLIQGVGRHDIDPRTGRVMTPERLREELALLKRFNVNAIRTSHYPNDPYLLDLADEYGLYVFDEADIEGHAFAGTIADNPAYLPRMLERYRRMVARDRNHASIIVWSLGNETGYGLAHDQMAAWSRAVDPTRPVHYEGAIANDWHAGHAATDIVCPMYPSIPALEAFSADERAGRPTVLCEYLYSQGNSTGGAADYIRAFEDSPGLQGGFVWGFLDHSLDPDGDGRYRYGGDFGDEPNDRDTLLFGIAFSDLTPKPAFHELRGLFSPVRITSDADEALAGTLRIVNRQTFADLGDLSLAAHVETRDGSLPAFELRGVSAGPGQTAVVELPAEIRDALAGDALALTLTVATATDAPWAKAGTALAVQQVRLPRPAVQPAPPTRPARVDERGDISHPLVTSPPRLSLWRAPTDNDRSFVLADRFYRTGFHDLRLDAVDVEELADVSRVSLSWLTAWGEEVSHVRLIGVDESGTFHFTEEVLLPESFVDGMRVGVVIELAPGLSDATWVGLGPWENYPDRAESALLARHSLPIDAMSTPYLRPQENGTRGGVTSLEFAGAAGTVRIESSDELHANVSRHSVADLVAHADGHWWELPAADKTVVHLDIAHRGVGTARLGPDVPERYRLSARHHTWRWSLQLP